VLSDAELRDLLFGAPSSTPGAEQITPDEQFLINHGVLAAALIPRHVAVHRDLARVVDAEGITPEVTAAARESAGELGAVAQSLARRPDLVVAADGTPLDPTVAIAVMEQLHFSCTVLAGAGTEGMSEEDARTLLLGEEELDALVALPGLCDWFAALGAPPPD
jgi:hypothetical protein